MAMGTNWPSLGTEPDNLKEHVTYLHEDCAHLHAVKGSYTAIPTTTIDPIINSTLRLLSKVTRHLDEQPDTRLATQIHDLFKEQRDVQRKDHEAIKAAIKAATVPSQATTPAGARVASWAQVAATAGPPPGHVTPPHTILSPSTSSTLTAYKGREVIVKLLDHGIAQHFRQLSPTQLKNKVNRILQEDPKVKNVKIVAAHQLKSGDVTVITDSLNTATELQTHTGWAKGLGPRAEVIRTTYGAIIHGIPVNTVNMKDQQGMIQRILADNYSVIPNAHISYVGWLTKDANKKRSSSLVVEFTRPEMANAIIYAGFLWEGLVHTCQLYDRSCRIKQCLRCYDYGHIGTQCNARQTCGHCAGGHESRACAAKNTTGFNPQCTVCKGSHTAWSSACPARQKEMRRVEKAKLARSHYWPIPARQAELVARTSNQTGPGSTNSTSEPTQPGEDASLRHPPDANSRILRRTRQQARVTFPPSISQTQPGLAQPTAHPQSTTMGPTLPAVQIQDAPTSLAPGATMMAPEVEDEDVFDTDDWLQNLDLGWTSQGMTGETPALSVIPEDQLQGPTPTAQELRRERRRQRENLDQLPPARKACSCAEHEYLYLTWPTRDAEITIGTCMKDCLYCVVQYDTTAELRKHIRRAHSRRNIVVQKEKMGDKHVIPGWKTISAPSANTQSTDANLSA